MKVVDLTQFVKHLLLSQELLEFEELHLIVEISGKSSLRNDHILLRILLLKLYNLPIICMGTTVHVTKLLRHLTIYPA